MADVQEIPLSTIPEDVQEQSEVDVEDPKPQEEEPVQEEVIEPTPKAKAKAKAKMGRPPGAKDTKQRAKPKPKAKIQRQISREIPRQTTQYEESDDYSESSADEASLQELNALQLMRSIRAYDQGRAQRKQAKYASWFGR